MMFGQQYPKMFIGVVSGLIDGKHHKRLGPAWMLFCWCIMRQTGQGTEGIVARGATVTYESIAEEMNCSKWNVRNWLERLIAQKYIRIERERYGFRIFVLNPKKFRVTKRSQSESIQSDQAKSLSRTKVSHSRIVHHSRNKDTYAKLLQNNLLKPLLNNKTAFQPFPSSENQMQTQRERQRQEQTLRTKAEWITAKYKTPPPTMGEAESKAYVQACIERARA